MNAKTPKFAIAPKGDYTGFKGGDKFEIKKPRYYFTDGSFYFDIVTPCGLLLYCSSKNCAHLNYKNWILRNK